MTSHVARGNKFEKTVKDILRDLGIELRQPR